MVYLILLSQLLFLGDLQAETSYWDQDLVRSYVHNSELQRLGPGRFFLAIQARLAETKKF